MKLLLDTNAFLWAGLRSAQLSPGARTAIKDAQNQLFLSSVTPWELAIKIGKGKLELPAQLAAFTSVVRADLGAMNLPILVEHAVAVADLPQIHGDPFDRMLVAQAMVEGLNILSSDARIAGYGVRVIW